ncbi:MAG: hypothetical protein QOH90_442, partial [Actinomycetota bacterium]|nr:hypothetical protein [Actinomycetota bacterium]
MHAWSRHATITPMVICSSCGHENPEASRFCMACGAQLGVPCPNCGAEVVPGARFCGSCGTSIGTAVAPTESRKLATVLFADVVGSTQRAEILDPEDARELMAGFFTAMAQEITAEGGTIEKYIGDAVMAVFGVPLAHEDDPQRAVRAARRMLARLAVWNGEGGHDLAIRIGVNTGGVLAAGSPGQDLLVTGDPVNVAARLEQAAEPGSILVGTRTARAVRGEFVLTPVEAISARGKTDPVETWEVVGERGIPEERGIPGLNGPMVGRDGQLGLLESGFVTVREQRRPRLVTIVADAGVGKSRLIREFAARVAPEAQIVSGRCLPYGEGVALWPLAEVLRSEAGIVQNDAPDEAIRKIEKLAASTFSTTDVDPVTIASLALTLALQLPDDPLAGIELRQVNRALRGAWTSFFSALAAAQPVVFVVEDIHWGDELMLDILEDLSERVEGALMVVASARPELLRTRSEWGGGLRNHSFVPLDPLTSDQSAELVDLLLEVDAFPERLKQRILDRSEGNPFFLEEIIRRMIDEEMLVRDGDRWRAAAPLEDVEIPDTVQAVILARLDLLTPTERAVIQHAAVVGRVFWLSAIESLGVSEGLDEVMQTLRRRELVVERLTSSMAGETEYIFKHILTRDVAYESIPRRARGPAHVGVARWIEGMAGERIAEFADLLSHHYATAFELTGDDALRDSAQHFAWRSVDNALRRFAVSLAEAAGKRAVELARPGRERVDAYERLYEAFASTHLGDMKWRALTTAIDEYRAAGLDDDPLLARLAANASQNATRWSGSMSTQPGLQLIEEIIDIGLKAAGEEDSRERALLLASRGAIPVAGLEASHEESERAGREAVAVAERIGDADLLSNCLDGLDATLLVQCRYAECAELTARRVELIPRLSDPPEVADVHNMMAWALLHLGRYEEATASARLAVEGAGDHFGFRLHGLTWLTQGLFMTGRWDEALETIDELLRFRGDDSAPPPPFARPAFENGLLISALRRDEATEARFAQAMAGAEGLKGSYTHHPFWIHKRIRVGDLDGAREAIDLRDDYLQDRMVEVYCDLLAEDPALGDASKALHLAREVSD